MKSYFSPGIAVAVLLFVLTAPSFGQQSGGASGSASVVITEYSDFQCPTCGYYYPMIKQLKEEYGDRLEIDYRYFPLNSHQFAALAARAAQAAKNQGKFEEMHDILFENQQTWSSTGNAQAMFIGYAREIGLDMEQFRSDLNSGETQQTVMEQKEEGVQRGVMATPTFYINGVELQFLPQTYENFKLLVESAIPENQE